MSELKQLNADIKNEKIKVGTIKEQIERSKIEFSTFKKNRVAFSKSIKDSESQDADKQSLKEMEAQELEMSNALSNLETQLIDQKNIVRSTVEHRNSMQMMFPEDAPDSTIRDYIEQSFDLGNVAKDDDGNNYLYDGNSWRVITRDDVELFFDKKILSVIIENGYSNRKVKSITDMCQRDFSSLPVAKPGYIGFNNGVLCVDSMKLMQHDKSFGLFSCADFDYDANQKTCPNFIKWMDHSCECDTEEQTSEKKSVVMAILYAIMTNRWEWQRFFEVVGEGGTGKSVFLKVARMLVGDKNVCSPTIDAIEKERFGLEQVVGKSLITVPDAATYVGKMDRLKAITGGDSISIDRKNKPIIDTVVNATVLITANNPLRSTDQSGGVWRRRVVVLFNNVVKKEDRDTELPNKLEAEKVSIFNYVSSYFQSSDDALRMLNVAINNKDKIETAQETEPLADWVLTSLIPDVDGRVQVGGAKIYKDANREGYGLSRIRALHRVSSTLLYSNYLLFCDHSDITRPISQKVFWGALSAMFNKLSSEGYIDIERKMPSNKATIYGISLNLDAEHVSDLKDRIDEMETENGSNITPLTSVR